MVLKKTIKSNLEILFSNQMDSEANQMAAFTSEDPSDKDAYMEKWSKKIINPKVNMQTIFIENKIVGSVLHFDMMEETNVSYWVGREHWGKGIATKALTLFLEKINKRPLVGRVAFDNYGSQRVLEKCGFISTRKEIGFSNARKKEIEEYVYILKV